MTPPKLGVPESALLILATILGLALDWAIRTRGGWVSLVQLGRAPMPPRTAAEVAQWLHNAAVALVPLAAAWTLALVATADGAIRPVKRLLQRPGLAASLSILPALAIAAAMTAGSAGWHPVWPAFAQALQLRLVDVMAAAVAFWWMVLLRGRIWRPVPGWADRLGLALGMYWILAFALIQGSALGFKG